MKITTVTIVEDCQEALPVALCEHGFRFSLRVEANDGSKPIYEARNSSVPMVLDAVSRVLSVYVTEEPHQH